ncbi:MAG: hypothetical protein AAFN93_17095, partial [Bacteroidota bacterium]
MRRIRLTDLFKMKNFLFALALLVASYGFAQTNEQKANIALVLPDNYHQLGESVKVSAEKVLLADQINAKITSYYYSDLNQISYQTLGIHQLVFIDIVNPTKVEG